MKMDGQIRVKINKSYASLYNDLKNLIVGDFHELFFVCACLGNKRGISKPLGKNGEEKFWSSTISPHEWICYYAILLQENKMNFNILRNDKYVISRIEEYANAGMEILMKEFLKDFIIESDDCYELDHSCSKELPKLFLHFLFEEISNNIDILNKQ